MAYPALSATNAVLAAVLLYAALFKLVRPDPLHRALAELGPPSWIARAGTVRLLAVVEVLAGVGLTLRPTQPVVAWVVGGLGVLFGAAGVVGLARRGSRPCGCLGTDGGRPLGVVNIAVGLLCVLAAAANLVTPAASVPGITASLLLLACLWSHRDAASRLVRPARPT